MSRIPPEVIDNVLERAADICEACAWPARGKMDFHHRKPRSRGGKDTAANLIWVHHDCHVISPWAIHQNPARSERLGHTLKTREDPETVGFWAHYDLRRLRA